MKLRSTPFRLAGAALALSALSGAASAANEAELQSAWRDAIAQTPTPAAGCFTAAYPAVRWTAAACVKAPNIAYVPRHGAAGWTRANGPATGTTTPPWSAA